MKSLFGYRGAAFRTILVSQLENVSQMTHVTEKQKTNTSTITKPMPCPVIHLLVRNLGPTYGIITWRGAGAVFDRPRQLFVRARDRDARSRWICRRRRAGQIACPRDLRTNTYASIKFMIITTLSPPAIIAISTPFAGRSLNSNTVTSSFPRHRRCTSNETSSCPDETKCPGNNHKSHHCRDQLIIGDQPVCNQFWAAEPDCDSKLYGRHRYVFNPG